MLNDLLNLVVATIKANYVGTLPYVYLVNGSTTDSVYEGQTIQIKFSSDPQPVFNFTLAITLLEISDPVLGHAIRLSTLQFPGPINGQVNVAYNSTLIANAIINALNAAGINTAPPVIPTCRC